MAKPKILVVEDDPSSGRLINHRLKHLGFQVLDITSSGEEAIQEISETSPDLVLMDIMLKGKLDGIKAADQIRDRFAIPVVFLTAYEDDELLQRAKITEPFGYILKPFNERELCIAIEMALYKHNAETKLKESEAKFRSLTETAASAIFIYQGNKIRYANPAVEKITGYTKKELFALNFWDIIHPDFQDLAKKQALARQRGESVPTQFEIKIVTKSGEERWLDVSAGVIEFEGKPAVIGTAFDITERKQAEETLRESEKRYRQIIEKASDVVYTTNPKGYFTYVNPPCQKLTGYSKDVLIKMHFIDLIPPEWKEQVQSFYRKQFLDRVRETTLEFPIITRSGEEKWVEQTVTLLSEGNWVTGFQSIIRDITDRKRAEEALKEAHDKLESKVEERTAELKEAVKKLKKEIADRKRAEEALRKAHEELEIRVKERTSELSEANQALQREIAERTLAEEALRESEKKYRTLVETSHDMIWKTDRKGIFTFINRRGAEILGYGIEETLGKDSACLIHPDDLPIAREHFLKVIHEGEVQTFELRVKDKKDKKGGYIILLVTEIPVFEDDKVVEVMAFGLDITERTLAEKALRKSEERFRLFTSAVTDVIYRYNPKKNQYDFISPSFELQTGYSIADIEKDPSGFTRKITHPDDVERVFQEVDEHIQRGPGIGPIVMEYRVIRKDNKVIWVSDRKDIEYTPDGKVYRINGVVRDITARKIAEEKLRESEERFRTIFQNAHDMIVYVDKHGKILNVNRAVEKILGYKPDDVIGKNFSKLGILQSRSIPKLVKLFKDAIKKGKVIDLLEMEVKDKNGNIISIESSTELLKSDGKIVGTVNLIRDISGRKRAEQEREALARLSQRLTDPLSVGEIGKIVAEESRSLFNHDAFSLDLLYKSKEKLIGIYTEDTPVGKSEPQEYTSASIPLKKIKFIRVLDGQPRLVNRMEEPEHTNLHPFGEKTRLSRSLMFVPILWKKQTIGIISVQSYTPGRYSQKELELLQTFANQCGGALARAQMEEALRESEEKFRTLFEDSRDAVYITTRDGEFLDINQAMEDLFGYTREEIQTLNAMELYDKPDDRKKFQQEIEQNGYVRNYGLKLRKKDGTVLECLLTTTVRKADDGSIMGYQGVIRDITELKRAETEREKLISELQEALDSIKTLRGLIPICAWCHKVRDDQGYWRQVEIYVEEHSEAEFSHGICPDCAEKYLTSKYRTKNKQSSDNKK